MNSSHLTSMNNYTAEIAMRTFDLEHPGVITQVVLSFNTSDEVSMCATYEFGIEVNQYLQEGSQYSKHDIKRMTELLTAPETNDKPVVFNFGDINGSHRIIYHKRYVTFEVANYEFSVGSCLTVTFAVNDSLIAVFEELCRIKERNNEILAAGSAAVIAN